MAQNTSLPPLKNNEGKYGIVAVLLLLGGGGAWYFLGGDDQQKSAEPPPPTTTPAQREQFNTDIEIPDLDAGTEEEDAAEPKRRKRREPVDCKGTLEAKEIGRAINSAARAQVRACYERRLKDNNLLQGNMNVLLTISPGGNVRGVSVSGSLNDSRVFSCVKKVARSWKFPKPDGGCVQTSVPFRMTPKQ